jgi:hypothetical protein
MPDAAGFDHVSAGLVNDFVLQQNIGSMCNRAASRPQANSGVAGQ